MEETNNMLMKINNLVEGQVMKRPSKVIKSPYVADVSYDDNEILAHSASLGCCGLADIGATILMTKQEAKTKKNKKNKQEGEGQNETQNEGQNQEKNKKCEYRIYLSVKMENGQEQIIGIYPKLAEQLVENALKNDFLSKLKNVQEYRRETAIFIDGVVDSRFDFSGIDENGMRFIMEVKNVPLADYEDVNAKERKTKNYDNYDVNSKIAYFPDGYRKKPNDTISPRALKHIKELTALKNMYENTRCLMCYVIQRTDVASFQPSIIDPQYREAFYEARRNGVEIITLVVGWNRNGEAFFIRDDLPINF
jgi:DNA-binding sugar fermentation-stimulating protein